MNRNTHTKPTASTARTLTDQAQSSPTWRLAVRITIAALLAAVSTTGCESGGTGANDAGTPDVSNGGLAPLVERCNGRDDDLDGETDEGAAVGCIAKLEDKDGDTFGVATAVCECNPTRVGLNHGLDCDDTNPDAHPGVLEICNDVDDNCDGETDNLLSNPTKSDGDHCGACDIVCDPLTETCQDGTCEKRCGDGLCDETESSETCCLDCGCHQVFGVCTETGCICTPACGDEECGYDGCGGKCGGCAEGKYCVNHECVQFPCGDCQNFGESSCEGSSLTTCTKDATGCGVITTSVCEHGCSGDACSNGASPPTGCPNDTSDCPTNQAVRCNGPCAYRCVFDQGWQHWKLIGSCAVHGANCTCIAIGPTKTVSACGIGGNENALCGFP